MSSEEDKSWIERARKGKTKAHRIQCYLQPREYEWLQGFMREHGIDNKSAAVRMCIRHVRIEHGMRERGYKSSVAKHEIDIDSLIGLKGTRDGVSQE